MEFVLKYKFMALTHEHDRLNNEPPQMFVYALIPRACE